MKWHPIYVHLKNDCILGHTLQCITHYLKGNQHYLIVYHYRLSHLYHGYYCLNGGLSWEIINSLNSNIAAAMKVTVNITGVGPVDIEGDNPEIITKLIESLTMSSILKYTVGDESKTSTSALKHISVAESPATKYVVGDELVTNAPPPKQMVSEARNLKSNLVAHDQDTVDHGTVDLVTADKWTEDITQYILSKQNYEHDLGELMDNVLGRRIKQSKERKYYDTFLNKIRLVRKRIKREYNIEWESSKMRYGRGSYPLTYKVKSNSQLNQEEHQSEKLD